MVIYIYYTAGNGLHLVEMYGSGGTDIINERISEVYEAKKIVYARAHSDVKRTDTSYYRVWYNDYSCIRVDTLTGNEFKQLTTGLQELISTIK